ncbi:hypothetical protein [Candidatus Amarolinea dominans]|uniref:hypothetical protein n=1 Tax=Candidatus Amarolinea dominans TaxID=3140696 RepID=UPI003135A92B|nr:hypothetical protein [Anaerolineae bacterium]
MLFSRQEMIRRIGLLRSAKLIFDLLVAALLLWQGWGWLPLLVLSADVAILWLLYPRLSQRQPVAAVLTTLLLTALLVLAALYDRPALAPLLLAFNVPLPAVAAVALGSGVAVLAAAGLATLATVAAMALAWQLLGEGAPVLLTWAALTVGAIWLQALALRQFVLEERRQRTPFDAAASIANGLTVVTVNDAIFETPTEVLAKLLRRQADNSGVRWLVLDLATSTPVTPTEIERLTQAARNGPIARWCWHAYLPLRLCNPGRPSRCSSGWTTSPRSPRLSKSACVTWVGCIRPPRPKLVRPVNPSASPPRL